MTFTDDDLKRLKDSIMRDGTQVHDMRNLLLPLLARLEAAEKCIRTGHTENIHGQCMLDCKLCRNQEAWRKAAGR
jgi:hypothetical protein